MIGRPGEDVGEYAGVVSRCDFGLEDDVIEFRGANAGDAARGCSVAGKDGRIQMEGDNVLRTAGRKRHVEPSTLRA